MFKLMLNLKLSKFERLGAGKQEKLRNMRLRVEMWSMLRRLVHKCAAQPEIMMARGRRAAVRRAKQAKL